MLRHRSPRVLGFIVGCTVCSLANAVDCSKFFAYRFDHPMQDRIYYVTSHIEMEGLVYGETIMQYKPNCEFIVSVEHRLGLNSYSAMAEDDVTTDSYGNFDKEFEDPPWTAGSGRVVCYCESEECAIEITDLLFIAMP